MPVALPEGAGRPFDVVGLGLNSIDLIAVVDRYPPQNTKQRVRQLALRPGGQAATAMVTCARLGWRARYIGRFGSDEHGRMGRASLVAEGVDVSAAPMVEGATNQFALIIVDQASGDRTVLWDRHPALSMTADDVPKAAVQSGRVLLVDCHETAAATAAAQYARAAGMRTVIDVEQVRPGIEDLLREIEVIIAAQDFPEAFTGVSGLGRALETLAAALPAAVVCVTLGRDGSLARAAGREVRTAGFPVPCVDSTGAGDVFRGGFIAGWLYYGPQAELEEVLRYANATAALKCRAVGAREGIPRPAEVALLLATH